MKTKHFSFDLPEELIAQEPPAERGTSRLMVLDRQTKTIEHHRMSDFPDLVPPEALMIFNDSRVRKARLFGSAVDTGGRVEFFLLNYLSQRGLWSCLVSKTKKQRPGKVFSFPGGLTGIIEEADENRRLVRFTPEITEDYLERHGHIPLPPYIKREDRPEDAERYQTVYSRIPGSTAAPTAGLHFTQEILERIQAQGIETAFVTLHVGLGTFLPIRSESIMDHTMHKESYMISRDTADKVNRAKAEGRPILCVGTTSIRSVESAWKSSSPDHPALPSQGLLPSGEFDTDLFIYPGYQFKGVDQVFTNFHTPESTLLILVSAFAGSDFIKEAYQEAVDQRYRFFSYGDAMYIR